MGSHYSFYTFSAELSNRLGFQPMPFPVRKEKAESVFTSSSIVLDELLDELDEFIRAHPAYVERYASNAAQLAMICATNNIARDDFRAALANLNAGLRIAPQHKGLRVHQALALQINGYTEAAAMEYEQLLWDSPQAFDPLIRSLAAKAFAAIGEQRKALEILEFLPECAFLDPMLEKLRMSLCGWSEHAEFNSRKLICPTCGKSLLPAHKFCPACATPVPIVKQSRGDSKKTPAAVDNISKQYCVQCGSKLKSGVKFCANCGAQIYKQE